MKDSAIQWTDHTFNPWVGCTAVSPACDRCYAEGWARRTGAPELWRGARRRTTAAYWRQPFRWDHEARLAGLRRRVFCCSLADVFDNQVLLEWRADLWDLIAATPHLDWLLLTKRPQNIARMLPHGWGDGWPNVWLGTTAEDQREAERRIPHLQAVPAAVRFLSCEPLLEPIVPDLDGISWVICGGESGPGFRTMDPAWARNLRDDCRAEGAGFFFKQWSGLQPKRLGRELDGREWNEGPMIHG